MQSALGTARFGDTAAVSSRLERNATCHQSVDSENVELVKEERGWQVGHHIFSRGQCGVHLQPRHQLRRQCWNGRLHAVIFVD